MPLRTLALGLALFLSLPADTSQSLRGGPAHDSSPRHPAFTQAAPIGKDGLWARPDEPGAWLAWEQACTGVTGPLLAAWEKQLKDIAALVRACPVFKDIRGYYPMLTGCVEGTGGGTGPYGGTVHFLIWPPMTVERTPAGEPGVKKEWRYNHPGGISLMPRVNAYGDLAFSWAHYEDRDGRFYELPETSREIAGFPVIGGFLFLTAPGKPPLFTPITRERALRWLAGNIRRQAEADASMLASARRQYEDFVSPAGQARRAKAIEEAAATQRTSESQEAQRRRLQTIDRRREQDLKSAATPKPGSPEARTTERLDELESRLASMSPAERQQPAWLKRHPEGVRRLDYGDIVDAESAGARPLVVPNQRFFDLSLPKSAMQLVSVAWIDDIESRVRKGETGPLVRVPQAVVQQLDWRAIAAMLK